MIAARAHYIVTAIWLPLRDGLQVARVRLPLDLEEQIGAVSLEEGVPELDLFRRPLALVEVVHVKLSHKRVDI